MIGTLILSAAMAASLSGGGMQETKEQRDKRMAWWREARFGMFIHWGLYAIPAGEWKGSTRHGEWIRETAQIPIQEYDKFLPQFNPTKYNPKDWARMAKDAGMQYVVLTSKHHDGFGLFDSKHTDWDVMSSPYGRDIVRQYVDAVRAEGLVPCFYHSIMDWHHPDYLPRRSWETQMRPANGANMDRFVKYLRNQVSELLTNYGPIGVMWFDGEWEATWSDHYGKPLYELCRTLQPNVIVNNRVSNNRQGSMDSAGDDQRVGDFSTPEQTIPATGLPGVDWETCMTMNDNWGYNKNDKNWKSPTTLIRNLVDIVSKGGNYLLNVGPTATGEFPQESVERLAEIGRWMRVNGEAIYRTQASVFEGLTWGRSTTKGDTLYLHVFDWPKDGRLVVPGLGNDISNARLLGGGALTAERRGGDVIVHVPTQAANAHATVVALQIHGAPIIYRTPKIVAPAAQLVSDMTVTLDSGSPDLEVRYTLDGSEPNAQSTRYTAPFKLSASTTVKAAALHNGKVVSGVAERRFEKVRPWVAASVSGLANGLVCEVFAGDWNEVPDFDKLSAKSKSVERTIGLPDVPQQEEYVGRRYTGYVRVPEDGMYTFALTSDDGSKLWIDDQVAVDNDGLHSMERKTASVPLAKGWHKITVGWFNKTGGAALAVEWARTGEKLRALAGDDLGYRP